MTLPLVWFMLLSLRGLTLAILCSMDSPTKIWQNFSVYKILLPDSSAASLLLTTSHPFFKICTGYLSTHASLIKSISSPINPKLDSLPLIYLISFTSMFHHGLYAPHLSPFFNFHAGIPSKSYGQRSFSYAAPSLWNNLPQQVRTANNVNIFKSRLKTHLFNAVYWVWGAHVGLFC